MSRATRSTEEYLLKLQNGDPFLSRFVSGKGALYLSAGGLGSEFSNFSRHAIFVPTIYKIAFYSQKTQPLFYTIGNAGTIMTDHKLSGEGTYHIKSINGDFDIIPEHKTTESQTEISASQYITDAGNYNLFGDKELITGLAFNFDRKESDLTTLNNNELSSNINSLNYLNFNVINNTEGSLTKTLAEIDHGKKLWKLCVVLALLFLAIEVLLLRFMKG
jgi:hypothetical protein